MLYTATEVAEQINATKPTLKNTRNSIDEVLNGSI